MKQTLLSSYAMVVRFIVHVYYLSLKVSLLFSNWTFCTNFINLAYIFGNEDLEINRLIHKENILTQMQQDHFLSNSYISIMLFVLKFYKKTYLKQSYYI